MGPVSMTGFAQSNGALASLTWCWELRSVNGKSLDLRFRLPAGFDAVEGKARALLQQRLKRGSVQVTLSFSERADVTGYSINRPWLESLIVEAEALRQRLGGPPIQVEQLLNIRGVIGQEQTPDQAAPTEAAQATLLTSFQKALDNLCAMRAEEGARLAQLLRSQINQVALLTGQVRAHPARSLQAVKQRLAQQVAALLEQGPVLDEARLHQEAALLATRYDVQEELDRLDAHVAAFTLLLSAAEPVGRKLEFMTQELNREANTLSSKAPVQDISYLGLELKTIIDQIREQVQNIE